MRMIVSRFVQTFNSVRFRNQSDVINQVSNTLILQPKRYYKNFGHAEEGDPPSKMLWFGFGILIMIIGSSRHLHEWCDLFEEGEDRYKPEDEKMYQVPVNIR